MRIHDINYSILNGREICGGMTVTVGSSGADPWSSDSDFDGRENALGQLESR